MSNTEEHATMTTCKICNDTHTMALRDRDVMCTYCPVPCDACRAGGNGAFCATTPCSCVCHGGGAAESVEPAYEDIAVTCGATGIRITRDTPPMRLGKMTVSGTGSLGIDLGDDEAP